MLPEWEEFSGVLQRCSEGVGGGRKRKKKTREVSWEVWALSLRKGERK